MTNNRGGFMSVNQILDQIKLHGWCVIPRVIPKNKVDIVRESIISTGLTHNEKVTVDDYGKPKNLSDKNLTIRNLINVNQSFAPYLADKRILGVAKKLFGPYIRMRTGKGFVEYPGTKGGGLHGDGPFNQNPPIRVFAPYQDATMQLTTVWMLSSFTKKNGGTRLVPGSHRSETNGTAVESLNSHPGEIQATGPAGSVVLFDSRLWHTNGPNNSDNPRVGMVMLYFPWWLSQDPSMPNGTATRTSLLEETGLQEHELKDGTALVPKSVYKKLPLDVKPLFRHWVAP